MKKIKVLKIALLEKDQGFKLNDKDQGNYIIRSSTIFNLGEYAKINKLEDNFKNISDEDYNIMVETLISLAYDDLIKKSINKVDSIGLWFTFLDDSIIENSIDLATLNLIGETNNEIVPIIEFVKMTLLK